MTELTSVTVTITGVGTNFSRNIQLVNKGISGWGRIVSLAAGVYNFAGTATDTTPGEVLTASQNNVVVAVGTQVQVNLVFSNPVSPTSRNGVRFTTDVVVSQTDSSPPGIPAYQISAGVAGDGAITCTLLVLPAVQQTPAGTVTQCATPTPATAAGCFCDWQADAATPDGAVFNAKLIIADGFGNSASNTASIVIHGHGQANVTAIADSTPQTYISGFPTEVGPGVTSLISVTYTDEDPGQTHTISIDLTPAGCGTTSTPSPLAAGGGWTTVYTPAANYSGTCTVAATVADSLGASSTASLVLYVATVNTVYPPTIDFSSAAPAASNDPASAPTVPGGVIMSFDVSASDPAGLSLSVQWTLDGAPLPAADVSTTTSGGPLNSTATVPTANLSNGLHDVHCVVSNGEASAGLHFYFALGFAP
jgi:hypothetical protein